MMKETSLEWHLVEIYLLAVFRYISKKVQLQSFWLSYLSKIAKMFIGPDMVKEISDEGNILQKYTLGTVFRDI